MELGKKKNLYSPYLTHLWRQMTSKRLLVSSGGKPEKSGQRVAFLGELSKCSNPKVVAASFSCGGILTDIHAICLEHPPYAGGKISTATRPNSYPPNSRTILGVTDRGRKFGSGNGEIYRTGIPTRFSSPAPTDAKPAISDFRLILFGKVSLHELMEFGLRPSCPPSPSVSQQPNQTAGQQDQRQRLGLIMKCSLNAPGP